VLAPDALVLRVEQGPAPDDLDGHRILLAHVLDLEALPFLGVGLREVRHEEVLADARAGPGAGDVRPTTLVVDQNVPVLIEDRFVPEHESALAALWRVVVNGQRT